MYNTLRTTWSTTAGLIMILFLLKIVFFQFQADTFTLTELATFKRYIYIYIFFFILEPTFKKLYSVVEHSLKLSML